MRSMRSSTPRPTRCRPAPGVTVHLAPGHTSGVQFVRVLTRSGWLVLASDACHYTFLREREEVYPIVFGPGGLIETYARLRALASSDKLVIPGHDPIVMRDFRLPAKPWMRSPSAWTDA